MRGLTNQAEYILAELPDPVRSHSTGVCGQALRPEVLAGSNGCITNFTTAMQFVGEGAATSLVA